MSDENKLPLKINLFGRTIKVEVRESLPLSSYTDSKEDLLAVGCCYFVEQVVMIKACLDYDSKMSTLLHEIIHMISDQLSLNLSEKQVCGLEAGLFSIIKDLKFK